ncbi:MAG TPA: 2-C-methyl-D-erythritol 4-phosphate cytidylyltransferase [Candidatus Avidehalobacter gallistercoris]|uniref:2-C-methyl-D-erythritol 4-phosphate cytidylyltransferase n=1 Tax=Candidatus Avidehalobacter gallistercoris TaxID=2840694 RepID=A0A9D1KY94_9FIRM|nr:2-C-methyl-D-erythritol 4-phosphate cytidylyltransferase [Candidatus Avidehalobacter gallistercoris]
MQVAVVVLAAGQGRRMGAGINKVFLPLGGEPVLLHSLRIFQDAPQVTQIVVAAASGEVQRVKDLLCTGGITKAATVVEGGSTRLRSVAAALPHISVQTDFVAIHDGARPLLSAADFKAVLTAAVTPGVAGAILAAPVTDTIKALSAAPVKGRGEVLGRIAASPARELLWRALTPQVFAVEPLLEAYSTLDKDFTDDAALLAAAGCEVALVWGSEENIKITTPLDLRLAELILREREAK